MLSPRKMKRSFCRASTDSQTGCGFDWSAQQPKAMRRSARPSDGCGSECEPATGSSAAARPRSPRAAAPASVSDWRSISRRAGSRGSPLLPILDFSLLVGLPSVPDPACLMLPLRVVMRPVHDAAPVIPLVHAVERDLVADGQRVDARCHVDIVRDQERMPGVEREDESLMAVALDVVAKDP